LTNSSHKRIAKHIQKKIIVKGKYIIIAKAMTAWECVAHSSEPWHKIQSTLVEFEAKFHGKPCQHKS
jgi:hypothetical protein